MDYALYIVIVVIFVTIDQLGKYTIVKNFVEASKKIIIPDFFEITYVKNYGAGFSIMQNQTILLIAISIFAIIVVSFFLIKAKKDDKLNKCAYLLIIGGTLGNLIDRIRYSYVVDFLDFYIFNYDFPVFNFADCFLTIGCILLIISILVESKRDQNKTNC